MPSKHRKLAIMGFRSVGELVICKHACMCMALWSCTWLFIPILYSCFPIHPPNVSTKEMVSNLAVGEGYKYLERINLPRPPLQIVDVARDKIMKIHPQNLLIKRELSIITAGGGVVEMFCDGKNFHIPPLRMNRTFSWIPMNVLSCCCLFIVFFVSDIGLW